MNWINCLVPRVLYIFRKYELTKEEREIVINEDRLHLTPKADLAAREIYDSIIEPFQLNQHDIRDLIRFVRIELEEEAEQYINFMPEVTE